MENLIRRRFGQHVCIFNTSKTPMPEIDSMPVSNFYEDTPNDSISKSIISHMPGMYIDEEIGSAPGPEYKKLENAIKESCAIIALLSERSAEREWVKWEAQQSPFEPQRYVPVYGAVLSKNCRELMSKFLSVSFDSPADDDPTRKDNYYWAHQLRTGEDIVIESIYFDIIKQKGLQELFSKLEESTGLCAVTEIDLAAEAAMFERFI